MSDAELIAGVRALLLEYNHGIEHWNKTLPVPHVIAKWRADAQLLANIADRLAALTAPGDDGEPVTEEWLKAQGFLPNGTATLRKRFSAVGEVCVSTAAGYNSVWSVSERVGSATFYVSVPTQPTRGHVRQLCAALGVPLPTHPPRTAMTDAELIADLRSIGDALPFCVGVPNSADAQKVCNAAADRLAALTAPGDDGEPVTVIEATQVTGNIYRLVTESAKYGRVSQTVLMMPRPAESADGPLSPAAPPPVPAEVRAAARRLRMWTDTFAEEELGDCVTITLASACPPKPDYLKAGDLKRIAELAAGHVLTGP